MKILTAFDANNYQDTIHIFEKYSVRGIIVRDKRIAMQCSSAGEYKIPGGGPEEDEDFIQALMREVHEETGLRVIESSVLELGEIVEMRRDIFQEDTKYICHSLFYFCKVEDGREDALTMTESERERGYHLKWVMPEEIIEKNQAFSDMPWILRDTEFIRMLADKRVLLPVSLQ